MPIPTTEQFADCLGLIKKCSCRDFEADFDRTIFMDETNSNGRSLVRYIFQQRDLRSQAVWDHVAVQWLSSQQAFEQAFRRTYSDIHRRASKERLTDDELRALHESSVMLRLTRAANDLERSHRFDATVREFLFPSSGVMRWYEGLLMALNEYFYTDNAHKILAAKKNREDLVKRAISGIEAIKSLSEDEFAMEAMHKSYRFRFRGSSMRMDEMLQSLHQLSAIDVATAYPVARSDDTLAERLFVYRISRLNWRLFTSFKAEAIANLLLIEGFRTALDARTIEKMCRKFKENRRQLFAQIDATTTGS